MIDYHRHVSWVAGEGVVSLFTAFFPYHGVAAGDVVEKAFHVLVGFDMGVIAIFLDCLVECFVKHVAVRRFFAGWLQSLR